MGAAVWEYMWLLDKITLIDKNGIGWVLGKKPINLNELAKQLCCSTNTISRNLNKLKKHNYITKYRTPHGMVIGVYKAKKRFNKNSESPNVRITNIVESRNENGESRNENGESNKTVSVDNTVDNISNAKALGAPRQFGNPQINQCMEFLKSKIEAELDESNKKNRNYCHSLLQKFKKQYPNKDPIVLVKWLIQFGLSDDFHRPNITNFRYLFNNAQKIINKAKEKYKKQEEDFETKELLKNIKTTK